MPGTHEVIERDLRHPQEWRAFAVSVAVNLAIIAATIALVLLAAKWLDTRPALRQVVHRIRGAVIILVLALPVFGVVRRARWLRFQEDSVQLGDDQVPVLHRLLEEHCRKLGLERVPDLYVSATLSAPSSALSLFGGRQVIVLGVSLFSGMGGHLESRTDALAFILGHELGRLRLGHASWWTDLLLAYLKLIPVFRTWLVTVETTSRDRYGAALAPDGVRGLLLLAAGGQILESVNPAAYVRKAMQQPPSRSWDWLSRRVKPEVPISCRIQTLYKDGFFDLERDLARLERGNQVPRKA